jgi:hypothetical protein
MARPLHANASSECIGTRTGLACCCSEWQSDLRELILDEQAGSLGEVLHIAWEHRQCGVPAREP